MGIKTENNTEEFSIILNLEIGSIIIDSGSIETFYFIEDIFSFSNVGKMIFRDNKGITEFGPFTGNETLTISYGNDSEVIRTFHILKTSKITQMGHIRSDGKQIIELFFVDHMYIILTNLQFSKSWKNKKISEIIEDITFNFLGLDVWGEKEETNEILEYFYIPQTWKLNTVLNWLLKRGSGKDSGQAGFCYFRNSKGMNLITLDKLLSQKKIMKISDDDKGTYVFEDINPYLYNKIQSWRINGLNNNDLDILSGGVRYGYNSLEKNLITLEYNYKDMIKDHTILGKQSLFPDISETRMKYINTGESNPLFIDNIFKNSWNKQYVRQQMISIICKGHEERYSGGLINIYWPSREKIQLYNKGLSGKYLIKSITHSFNSNRSQHYTQNMILIKNGHESLDFKTLEKSTKKNLK